MVGICRDKIRDIITDIFPPRWDFVMVGMCRKAMMMVMVILHHLGSESTHGRLVEEQELLWSHSSCPADHKDDHKDDPDPDAENFIFFLLMMIVVEVEK